MGVAGTLGGWAVVGVGTLGVSGDCFVTLGEFSSVVFFFFTNLVKMLLSCAIALYCSSPGGAKGDSGWWPWIALASALVARVASSKGDANGAAQL